MPTTAGAAIKLVLDRHSQHHLWRAGQWWERLPLLADVDRVALSRPPDPAWAAALDALAGEVSSPARLAGAYRVVVPRLAGRYRSHTGALAPAADGSARRTLGLVAADLAADWHEGEFMLQGVLDSASAADAGAAVGRLEIHFAG